MDYLGDGVYAQFDGYNVWLLANSPTEPTDKICLEPSVFKSLLGFFGRFYKVEDLLKK